MHKMTESIKPYIKAFAKGLDVRFDGLGHLVPCEQLNVLMLVLIGDLQHTAHVSELQSSSCYIQRHVHQAQPQRCGSYRDL